MADEANQRLKALKASMKVALGKLTGSDELEAQGTRERSGRVAKVPGKEPTGAQGAPPAKKASTSRAAKPRRPKR